MNAGWLTGWWSNKSAAAPDVPVSAEEISVLQERLAQLKDIQGVTLNVLDIAHRETRIRAAKAARADAAQRKESAERSAKMAAASKKAAAQREKAAADATARARAADDKVEASRLAAEANRVKLEAARGQRQADAVMRKPSVLPPAPKERAGGCLPW